MNKQKSLRLIWIISLAVLFLAAAVGIFRREDSDVPPGTEKIAFEEDFQGNGLIEETAKMSESSNPDWWVNSGGQMIIAGRSGKTIQGDLPEDSEWRKKYARSNPEDTDAGAHPQNIFRLVTRSKWQNLDQEAYFRINRINPSTSENRNESNGILFFNRYEDGDNLYYTGLRVDGLAVIKKKYEGEYHTLAEKRIFSGEEYDRGENPNLLPLNVWIGLKSEFRNTPDGDVDIRLFFKEGRDSGWKPAVNALDDGRKEFGKNILSDEGYVGIRTDFMDAEFSAYRISEIN